MNNVQLNEGLSQISLLVVYGAMAIYTFSFLAFATNLSRLASNKDETRATASGAEKFGTVMLILAGILHGVAVVLRGISASRVPWANMYEFTLTGSFIVVAIYLIAMILTVVPTSLLLQWLLSPLLRPRLERLRAELEGPSGSQDFNLDKYAS